MDGDSGDDDDDDGGGGGNGDRNSVGHRQQSTNSGDGNSDGNGGRQRQHDNGGSGGVAREAAGGDALPSLWRQLHDDGDSDGHGDGHSNNDSDGDGNGDGDGDGDGDSNKDGDGDLPPLQFHHPPSPGTPLNCIQRVRSWSREDIERGGLGIQGNQYFNIIILWKNSSNTCFFENLIPRPVGSFSSSGSSTLKRILFLIRFSVNSVFQSSILNFSCSKTTLFIHAYSRATFNRAEKINSQAAQNCSKSVPMGILWLHLRWFLVTTFPAMLFFLIPEQHLIKKSFLVSSTIFHVFTSSTK
jgi:hypothetical protein